MSRVGDWIEAAARTWPEPVALPEDLEDADLVGLADASNRLRERVAVTRAILKLVDERLGSGLSGGALRYGESIFRPASRKGRPVVSAAEESWWLFVLEGVAKSDDPVAVISALYNASDVRLTGLGRLAKLQETAEQTIRDTFISYLPATSPVDVTPRHLAPKWTLKLDDGQFSAGSRRSEPEPGK